MAPRLSHSCIVFARGPRVEVKTFKLIAIGQRVLWSQIPQIQEKPKDTQTRWPASTVASDRSKIPQGRAYTVFFKISYVERRVGTGWSVCER